MQAERPIKRGGTWWSQRPDGSWLRWDAQTKAWVPSAEAPPPDPEGAPLPTPPAVQPTPVAPEYAGTGFSDVGPSATPSAIPATHLPTTADPVSPAPVPPAVPAAAPAPPGPSPAAPQYTPTPVTTPAPATAAPIAMAPASATTPLARPGAEILPAEPEPKRRRLGRRSKGTSETVLPRRGAMRARRLLLWLVILAIVLGQSYYILAETDTLCYPVELPEFAQFAQTTVDSVIDLAYEYFQPDCS